MSTDPVAPKSLPPPPTEQVPASDVLASIAEGTVQKLTGQQWAALVLAAGIFLMVVGSTVFNFYVLQHALPALPSPPPTTASAADLEAYKIIVEQYSELTAAAHERARNMFETFVAAAFLPLFAGIVGFIFGRERAG